MEGISEVFRNFGSVDYGDDSNESFFERMSGKKYFHDDFISFPKS